MIDEEVNVLSNKPLICTIYLMVQRQHHFSSHQPFIKLAALLTLNMLMIMIMMQHTKRLMRDRIMLGADGCLRDMNLPCTPPPPAVSPTGTTNPCPRLSALQVLPATTTSHNINTNSLLGLPTSTLPPRPSRQQPV